MPRIASKRKRTSTKPEANESDGAKPESASGDMPFVAQWVKGPETPASKKRKLDGKGGVLGRKGGHSKDSSDPLEESGIEGTKLSGYYTVTPGARWTSMRRFHNFVINPQTEEVDDARHKFKAGDFVFVNHQENPDTMVENDRDSWVAQVREVRAEGQHAVFIRVIWMYWPEELPAGKEAYHGQKELVASNDLQIIDAMTVSGKATVFHMSDVHDQKAIPDDALYWRQTFDVRQRKLSSLPKECICKRVTNPEEPIIRCPNAACEKWQHGSCLIDATLTRYCEESAKRTEKAVQDNDDEENENGKNEDEEVSDTIEVVADGKEGNPTLVQKMWNKVTGAVTNHAGSTDDNTNNNNNNNNNKARGNFVKRFKRGAKRRRSSKLEAINIDRPWEGSLTAKLGKEEDESGDEICTGKATIYKVSTSDGEEVLEPVGTADAHCLFCQRSLVDEVAIPPNLDPALMNGSASQSEAKKNKDYDVARDAVTSIDQLPDGTEKKQDEGGDTKGEEKENKMASPASDD